jgi:hypothetical protein
MECDEELLSKAKKEALEQFDEAFEDALSELLDADLTEFDIGYYFGRSPLGVYICERLIKSRLS